MILSKKRLELTRKSIRFHLVEVEKGKEDLSMEDYDSLQNLVDDIDIELEKIDCDGRD